MIHRYFHGKWQYQILAQAWLLFVLPAFATDSVQPIDWWTAQRGRIPIAVQAFNILQHAEKDGLDPRDYLLPAWAGAIAGVNPSSGASGTVETSRMESPLPDTQMSAMAHALEDAMHRYLHDLHFGRINAAAVYANFKAPPKTLDIGATLKAAIAAGNLNIAVHAATPKFPMYQPLKRWLERFRSLERTTEWRSTLPPLPRNKLEPNQPYAGLASLSARLVLLGDLPPDLPLPDRYAGALVNAIQQFQTRHGLVADGVIGKTTFAQLNVTPADRADQIALTMERLRWTPLMTQRRMLLVNLPEFVLRGLEIDGIRVHSAVEMKVIVGQALSTRTPLLYEEMREIEFNPYWRVPQSIAAAELVPKLRRDPAYFDREGFEFVTGPDQVRAQLSEDLLSAVLRGEARLRQRPGPKNALGNIKFIFPNNDNIYIHHTPAVSLFRRDQRDLSHGCIRAENPLALAEFVLAADPGWPRERIVEAMAAGQSRKIRIKNPLPVVIAYGTAVVKQAGGPIFFYRDVYGHDQELKAALKNRNKRSPGQGENQNRLNNR